MTKVELLESENKEKFETIDRLEKKNEDNQKDIKHLQEKIDELDKLNRENEASYSNKYNDVVNDISDVKTQFNELKESWGTLNKELEEKLMNKIKDWFAHLEDERNKTDHKIKNLDEKNRKIIQDKYNELNSHTQVLKKLISGNSDSIENLHKDFGKDLVKVNENSKILDNKIKDYDLKLQNLLKEIKIESAESNKKIDYLGITFLIMLIIFIIIQFYFLIDNNILILVKYNTKINPEN